MLLTVALAGPAGHEESAAVDAQGADLGFLLQQYAQSVEACLINGRLFSDWQNYIPQKNDRVRLVLAIQEPISTISGIIAGTVTAIATATGLTVATVQMIIGLAISMALSAAIRALTPNPKAPKLDGAGGQAFGITGFQNTTGQGVPIPVWYGEQRVWGHVIASGAELSSDYSVMKANILYCLGDSGGDGYQDVSDILIDRIPVDQYKGVWVHIRLGYAGQSVIPEFSATRNLFADGRTLPYDEVAELGTTIPYTTRGNNVNLIKLIVHFPGGLFRIPNSGKLRSDFVELRIEFKKSTDPIEAFVVFPSYNSPYYWFEEAIRSPFFRDIWIDTSILSTAAAEQYWIDRPDVAADPYHGSGPYPAYQHWIMFGQFEGSIWHSELGPSGQWDIRVTVNNAHIGDNADGHATTIILFNVEEISFTGTNYPGYVLLGIVGLQGNQVRNLQAVEVSAMVKGKRCKNILADQARGLSTGYDLYYTRERAIIVRDMMTNPIVGMGYEFDESEIDDAQWYTDATAYYNELVDAQDGSQEPRDLCDVGITERRWDWDWVKRVASEGRACIVPSGLKWKYLVDKPGVPNLLLAEPGNIIEGSISMEIAPPDDPFNQIVGQFRDSASDYTSELSQPIDSIVPRTSINQKVVAYETITRESEVLRENMVQMKRQDLEKRRFSFVSPSSQLLGEPLDLDWLSERTIGDIGAYTGVLPAGCTQGSLFLPYGIDLEAGKNYLAIVQHKGMSLCETRLIITAAGHWSQVDMATGFDVAPEEGAIFAIGEANVDHIITRARDFQIDDQGHITQLRTEYVEEVYRPDDLPPGINRKRFPLSRVPPIPLRDAWVICELVQRKDGSWGSVIHFDITPGLAVHGGHMAVTAHTALPIGIGITEVNTTVIVLDLLEPQQPEQNNYYRGAYLMCIDGAFHDLERRILYYDAPSRSACCEEFPGLPTGGTMYRIRWINFSETFGFKIEQSTDRINWMEVARPVGLHFERDGGDQGGTWYHRFTPYNSSGVFNDFAPLVRDPVTFFGDTVPPLAPAIVSSWGILKSLTVDAAFALPTSLDLAAIEAEVWRFDYLLDAQGNYYRGNLVGYANARAGANGAQVGQTGNVRMVFDLSNNPPPYDAFLYTRVRSIDFSGNVSGWTQSNDFQLQRITDADIL